MIAGLGLALIFVGALYALHLGFGPACRRCGVQDGTERYHGLCLACDRTIRHAAMGLTATWRKGL